MGNKALLGQFSRLADLPVNSPQFGILWNSLKAASKGAAVSGPATTVDPNKPIYVNPNSWDGRRGGPVVERIKRNTLDSLYGRR
jgi:hypothetical protein